MTPDKQSEHNRRRRERYAVDSEYRKQVLTGNRRYREKNREEINARIRRRLESDPELRQAVNKGQRERRDRNCDEINARNRQRYHSHPEHRQKRIDCAVRAKKNGCMKICGE